MGPIEQLVQERLPPDRAATVQAFAQAYLRRLTAAGDDDGHDPEALYHELLGAFELAAARDGAPMAVRAFNPTRAEHGYEPGGVGAGDQHRGPPVPRRLGQRRAAGAGPGDRARAAPDHRHRALARRRHRADPPSRRRAGHRVGHALRARPAPGARGPRRPRGRGALGAGRRAPRGARLPPAARARGGGRRGRPRRGRPLRQRRGGRGRGLPRVARARQLHLPRSARLRAGGRRAARGGWLGPGTARRRAALGMGQAGPRRDAGPEPARARPGGRAAAGLQDATGCRRCTAACAWTTSGSAASRPTARSSARRG